MACLLLGTFSQGTIELEIAALLSISLSLGWRLGNVHN
jgi:hypothetical protein